MALPPVMHQLADPNRPFVRSISEGWLTGKSRILKEINPDSRFECRTRTDPTNPAPHGKKRGHEDQCLRAPNDVISRVALLSGVLAHRGNVAIAGLQDGRDIVTSTLCNGCAVEVTRLRDEALIAAAALDQLS